MEATFATLIDSTVAIVLSPQATFANKKITITNSVPVVAGNAFIAYGGLPRYKSASLSNDYCRVDESNGRLRCGLSITARLCERLFSGVNERQFNVMKLNGPLEVQPLVDVSLESPLVDRLIAGGGLGFLAEHACSKHATYTYDTAYADAERLTSVCILKPKRSYPALSPITFTFNSNL
jgi:hypothetical protein